MFAYQLHLNQHNLRVNDDLGTIKSHSTLTHQVLEWFAITSNPIHCELDRAALTILLSGTLGSKLSLPLPNDQPSTTCSPSLQNALHLQCVLCLNIHCVRYFSIPIQSLLHATPLVHQLTKHDTLSQASSDSHNSIAAQQGSTASGTSSPQQVQQPRDGMQYDEKSEDHMKLDLLFVGSQFESSK